MFERFADTRARLFGVAWLALALGLGAALALYASTEEPPAAAIGYEDEGGAVSTVRPGDSKVYQRGMELYGGRSNVLASELRLWFLGQWQGKSLARSVALITLLIVGGLLYVALHTPPGARTEDLDPDA